MRNAPLPARLLFLSANPNDRGALSVDYEYNRVRGGLQALGIWPEWKSAVEHVPAATWEQLPEQLLLHSTSIVHFSGHGHPDGSLEFCSHDGLHQRIDRENLAALLQSYADQIHLVVLNACYSDSLAELLTMHIGAVIGTTHAVSDESAVLFSPTFYQQLAGGKSVQTAFDVSRSLLTNRSQRSARNRDIAWYDAVTEESPLRLRVRTNGDASLMHFAPSSQLSTIPVARAHLSLTFKIGQYAGAEIPLPLSGVLRIGRLSGLEITLYEQAISRAHAHIQVTANLVMLTDLKSTTGTFVNDHRLVGTTRLRIGDVIRVGTSSMEVTTASGNYRSLEEASSVVEAYRST